MTVPVKDIMTRKLVTIQMGSSAFKAHKKMQDLRIRHLPVVDELDDIVGVLSLRDVSNLSRPEAIPVEFVMSATVQNMNQNTPIRSAILKMLELKISSLLVIDEQEDIVGIVTTDDMLWFLAHKLRDEPEESKLISDTNLHTIGKLAHDLSIMGI